MDITIWEKIASTSWWYYVWFGLLIWFAFQVTKPRLIPLRTIFLFACFFLGASSTVYFATQQQSLMNFILLIAAFVLGLSLGWLEFHILGIQVIKEKAILRLPGTWLFLLLIILGTSAKFYWHGSVLFYPNFINNPEISPYISLFFGTSAGFFFGRVLYGKHCLKYGPFISDQKPMH